MRKIQCSCGKRYLIDEKLAGKVMKCKVCEVEFVIPDIPEDLLLLLAEESVEDDAKDLPGDEALKTSEVPVSAVRAATAKDKHPRVKGSERITGLNVGGAPKGKGCGAGVLLVLIAVAALAVATAGATAL